ncbi:hypothetical protein [Methylorubrum extorquens]|uniref:Uncharacterized protein n=1 Tax=Methylorubrum extorquens DSM 13060 TaxID=882800 RepID=H1KQL8_METEX|nr:hypothetical protein [Methylorubrum extorquens]EHP90174.1 hypothetical protein MetexDRAFT_4931 [Methylorubrum extorquens DSM 13060]
MQKDDVYIHRMNRDFVVRVDGVRNGVVTFASEGGGPACEVPAAKFEADFEAETPDARSKRLAYEKGAVSLESWEDAEGGYQLPAWLNGSYWNGWLMPAFEKQDLLDAIAKDMLYGAFYHEASDAFIVLANNGEDLPAFDPAVLFPRIMAEGEGTDLLEVEVDGVALEATIYRGRDIARADGTPVHVYDLGAGFYTWERAKPADEPASSPTP